MTNLELFAGDGDIEPMPRADRDRYGDRTDVLDKVKALQLLPDGMHVTTEMVANYYEVPLDAIEKCVRNNRDELTANGFQTLTGARLSAFKAECRYPSRAPRLGVFNPRAVVRVGLLLRDSPVAVAVRDAVQDAYDAFKDPRFNIPRTLPDALELAALEMRGREAAEARVVELEPKAEAYDELMTAEGDYTMATTAQMLGLGQNRLFARLREENILFDKGRRRNTPYQQYMRHFRVVMATYDDGTRQHVTYTTYVLPSGVDWIRKLLKLPPAAAA